MKLSLVVLVPGNSKGKTIHISRTPYVIGRDPKCQLRPSNALISNRHCALEIRSGKVIVTDLGSTNGTSVNGKKVEKDRELVHGDRLQVGPLAFEIRIEVTAAVDQRTPLPPTKAADPGDDEAIAAVLLSMQEETPTTGSINFDVTGVPTGGTAILDPTATVIMEAKKPEAEKDDPEKRYDTKKKEINPANDNTSAVAEQLLNKYLRRPRKVT